MSNLVGIITLGILVVVFLFLLRLTKWRYKQAFAMGRIEHAAGRLLGGAILLTCFLAYFHKDVFFLCVVDFLIWIIYLCSHTAEKFFFPKHNRTA
jgi:hypothetical protein